MRHLSIRTVRSALIALAIAGTAGVAGGASITVTTHDDVVADDGACSLREAVTAVNSASPSGSLAGECVAGDGADTILLETGTYRTTLGPVDEDANQGGDLDIARSLTIEGAGSSTRIRNGLGAAAVLGDGDRLFHIDPAGAGNVDVTFRRLALMDGEAYCDTANCFAGAGAIEASQGRDLIIEDCAFSSNLTACSASDCNRGSGGSAAAIVHGAGGNLSIARTTFTGNIAGCGGLGCATGQLAFVQTDLAGAATATVEVTDLEIGRNLGTCFASGCSIGDVVKIDAGQVVVSDTELVRNTAGCDRTGCSIGSILEIDATTTELVTLSLVSNRRSAEADSSRLSATLSVDVGMLTAGALILKSDRSACEGSDCEVGELFDVDADLAEIDGLTARSNRGLCDGDDCVVEERVYVARSTGSQTLRNALISGNQSRCRSDGCRAQAVLFLRGAEIELATSEVRSNKVSCKGDSCEITPAVAVYATGESLESLVDSVDILANRCSCRADFCTALAPACGLFVVSDGTASVRLRGSTVAKNKGDSVGAGLGNLASLVVEDSEIARNRTTRGGGGIYNGADLSLTGSSITGNRARAGRASYTDLATLAPICGDGVGGCGGGILNQGTISAISTTTIADNRPDDCVDDGGSGCP